MDTFMTVFLFVIVSIVGLAIFALVVAALYGIFCFLFSRNKYSAQKTVSAKVVAKTLIPEHGGLHAAPIIGGNGGVAISSDHEDEQDIVVLKSKELGITRLDSEDLLFAVKQDEVVDLTYKERHTYWVWEGPLTAKFADYVPLEVKTSDSTVINVEGA